MSTTMTVRLDNAVKQRLDALAEATRCSKSFLAAEAIRAYLENNEWQIGEIQAAIVEADAGDFASESDAAALARKWKVKSRRLRDRW
jgi:predicted transcriptional regulator